MENNGPPANGTHSPGDRLSRLSAAILRINESLNVDAALQAVMDGARSLTGAPYAAIITLDVAGWVENHLVLGFHPADVERLWQAPKGEVFFQYLNALARPLRVRSLEEFTGFIGLGEFRSPVKLTAFMAAPILHQRARAGNLYVGNLYVGNVECQGGRPASPDAPFSRLRSLPGQPPRYGAGRVVPLAVAHGPAMLSMSARTRTSYVVPSLSL